MRKKKIEPIEIIYPLFLLVVAIFIGVVGYLIGETIAYNENATAVTKAHLEEYQKGYTYCPYCGEELKKEVK